MDPGSSVKTSPRCSSRHLESPKSATLHMKPRASLLDDLQRMFWHFEVTVDDAHRVHESQACCDVDEASNDVQDALYRGFPLLLPQPGRLSVQGVAVAELHEDQSLSPVLTLRIGS